MGEEYGIATGFDQDCGSVGRVVAGVEGSGAGTGAK